MSKKRRFESRKLPAYFASAVCAFMGMALLFVSVTERIPSPGDLREVNGKLGRYDFVSGARNQYLAVLTTSSGRYWTNDVTRRSGRRLFGVSDGVECDGVFEVRLFVDPNSRAKPFDGNAIKSYGLWINGITIKTVEDALERDRLLLRFAFPLLGLTLLGLAVFVYKRSECSCPE